MDTTKYPSEVFWSDEDQGYIAFARDLPGCSAFGASREEAARELGSAILAWIEAAQNAGNSIPPPSPRLEPSVTEPSGKFLVRMPKSLHRQLSVQAVAEGVSLNQYVVYLLSERHASFSNVGVYTNNFVPFANQQTAHVFNKFFSYSTSGSITQNSLENFLIGDRYYVDQGISLVESRKVGHG
ncbi:toxin-antitoxin system HicB family antitoxin [Methylocapsa aurea]|uniref:toxin-antitoxin system HicB family antitoxin n=1 Tax=Methylocapsa aurea TaxID=663610 RepID=UPI003D18EC40